MFSVRVRCSYVFCINNCGRHLTSLLFVAGTSSKMATLVLDNGAYTAKIGYSQEKVRYDVSKTANATANNKESVQLIGLKHVDLQHSVINTSADTRSGLSSERLRADRVRAGRTEMDKRMMQNIS